MRATDAKALADAAVASAPFQYYLDEINFAAQRGKYSCQFSNDSATSTYLVSLGFVVTLNTPRQGVMTVAWN